MLKIEQMMRKGYAVLESKRTAEQKMHFFKIGELMCNDEIEVKVNQFFINKLEREA